MIYFKKKVNFLYYSRDTNLLFSAGDDGNLFIYAIYEYPDGETVAFDDNKAIAINQINSILDEGLGDNVLLNLNEIFGLSDKMLSKNELIYKLQRNIDESTKPIAINNAAMFALEGDYRTAINMILIDNSLNGTYDNGTKLVNGKKILLETGDKISFGSSALIVVSIEFIFEYWSLKFFSYFSFLFKNIGFLSFSLCHWDFFHPQFLSLF